MRLISLLTRFAEILWITIGVYSECAFPWVTSLVLELLSSIISLRAEGIAVVDDPKITRRIDSLEHKNAPCHDGLSGKLYRKFQNLQAHFPLNTFSGAFERHRFQHFFTWVMLFSHRRVMARTSCPKLRGFIGRNVDYKFFTKQILTHRRK